MGRRGKLETAVPNVDREEQRAVIERDNFYLKYNIDTILNKLLAGAQIPQIARRMSKSPRD
jgi:hypothetical protein